MPRRRKCSIERALVLLHFGCCAVVRFSVTSTVGTPRHVSSIPADNPTGPPPTINAKVSACMGHSIKTHRFVIARESGQSSTPCLGSSAFADEDEWKETDDGGTMTTQRVAAPAV